MRYVEVLCEGNSDVPALKEVLRRRFGLNEEENFRIHAHQGKGKLPSPEHRLRKPPISDRTLLGQLPVKLKNMGQQSHGGFEIAVVVVVDADDDDCRELKRQLVDLYNNLPTRPPRCLFRIAIEETESWFIAEPAAVKKAYAYADISGLTKIPHDSICGAWEKLASVLGLDAADCVNGEKTQWATNIAPHLNLDHPKSPSLAALVSGVDRLLK